MPHQGLQYHIFNIMFRNHNTWPRCVKFTFFFNTLITCLPYNYTHYIWYTLLDRLGFPAATIHSCPLISGDWEAGGLPHPGQRCKGSSGCWTFQLCGSPRKYERSPRTHCHMWSCEECLVLVLYWWAEHTWDIAMNSTVLSVSLSYPKPKVAKLGTPEKNCYQV